MPSPAPAPRLPLEPSARPLYRPPARIGCSGVSLVSLITVVAFVLFLRTIAPALTNGIAAVQLPSQVRSVLEGPGGALTPTAEVRLDTGVTPLPALRLTPTLTAPEPTDTAAPAPPTAALAPTLPPLPPATSPTPAAPEYLVVANTDGTGVYLRSDPQSNSKRLVALPDKTLVVVVGPDRTVAGQVWRNVHPPKDNAPTGWILAQYLAPATPP